MLTETKPGVPAGMSKKTVVQKILPEITNPRKATTILKPLGIHPAEQSFKTHRAESDKKKSIIVVEYFGTPFTFINRKTGHKIIMDTAGLKNMIKQHGPVFLEPSTQQVQGRCVHHPSLVHVHSTMHGSEEIRAAETIQSTTSHTVGRRQNPELPLGEKKKLSPR